MKEITHNTHARARARTLKFERIVASHTFRKRPENLLDTGPVERIFLSPFFLFFLFLFFFSLPSHMPFLFTRKMRACLYENGDSCRNKPDTIAIEYKTCTKVPKYAKLLNSQPETPVNYLNVKQ